MNLKVLIQDAESELKSTFEKVLLYFDEAHVDRSLSEPVARKVADGGDLDGGDPKAIFELASGWHVQVRVQEHFRIKWKNLATFGCVYSTILAVWLIYELWF